MLEGATVHRHISSISSPTSAPRSHSLPVAEVHAWHLDLVQRPRGAHPPYFYCSPFSRSPAVPAPSSMPMCTPFRLVLLPPSSFALSPPLSSPLRSIVPQPPSLASRPLGANNGTLNRNYTSPYLQKASTHTASFDPGIFHATSSRFLESLSHSIPRGPFPVSPPAATATVLLFSNYQNLGRLAVEMVI